MEGAEKNNCATVSRYYVLDTERFGVVAFDENREGTSIEEKPIVNALRIDNSDNVRLLPTRRTAPTAL